MRILADENIPFAQEYFGKHGQIQVGSGRALNQMHLIGADALIVRSVTQVNKQLLHNTPVQFVGSCTIGTDHLDLNWLNAHNIHTVSAPGCNADAAAQFTLALVLQLCHKANKNVTDLTVGIVGAGNVGSRVHALLKLLGVKTLCYDPFKDVPDAASFNEVLQTDLITLHTPLTTSGEYPTHHLFNDNVFKQLPKHTMLINCARGDVIEEGALLRDLENTQRLVALDVWPNEPYINNALIEAITLATPHVAGYSVQGKVNGTLMVYKAFCAHFGLEPVTVDTQTHTPETLLINHSSTTCLSTLLRTITEQTTDILGDDKRLRDIQHIAESEKPLFFDTLRKQYTPRHEFCAHSLSKNALGASEETLNTLKTLGFNLV